MAAIENMRVEERNTIILAAGNCMLKTLRGAQVSPVLGGLVIEAMGM